MIKEYFKTNRILAIKKTIAVLLILSGILFVLLNRDVYYSKHISGVRLKAEIPEEETLIRFSGDRTYEQQFTGWEGELKKVTIRIFNQGKENSSGNISVDILDSDGTVLLSAQKPLKEVINSVKTAFLFKESEKLSKNTDYTLRVTTHEASNPQGFGIYTHTNKGTLFGQLTENNTPIEGRLRATFIYRFYNSSALYSMLALLFFALLFVMIPFGRIDALLEKYLKLKTDTNILVSRLLFLATPLLCIFLGDRFNGYHLAEMLRRLFTWHAVFNLVIYTVLWLIVYMIVNRTQYTSMIVLGIVFLADIVNYYVWVFRGCPILAADLLSAATAMNVADNFSYTLDLTGIWGTVYITVFTAMLLSLKGYKGLQGKRRIISVATGICSIFMFHALFFQSDFPAKHVKHLVWRPQSTYAKNGNALSFLMSYSASRVDKPDGYSSQNVKQLIQDYPSDTVSRTGEADKSSPNIIAIMNEALADLNYNNTINLSEDYLPFLHSLKENTVKGQLFVSIEGANTANTEFEFLTGDTMNFLPYRCIPYNEYINKTTPSMAHTLKAQGYAGVNAYHPFKGSGWSRTIAYPALGFNNFYDMEYYRAAGNNQLVRNYISDMSDYQQIIDDYEASKKKTDAPFYLFNVTMQNHGAYTGKRGLVDTKIKITDDALQNFEAEQYINLAKLSDDAFKMLVEYFKKVDEPTIIVMFGDHQPPISNDFYNTLFGKDTDKLSVVKKADWYSTPYVIWANYDIEEKELDMSANYLSSYVMSIAGNKLTGYNKYLLELQKELPVISAVCYKDKDGNVYANDEKSKYSELLHTYRMLQYNQLFDEEGRLDEFFFLQK